jgi:hypothetical protein
MQKLMFVPMLKKIFVLIACFIFVYSNAQNHPFLYINKHYKYQSRYLGKLTIGEITQEDC